MDHGPAQALRFLSFGVAVLLVTPSQRTNQVETELGRMRDAYASIRMARVRFVEERPDRWRTPAEGVIEIAGPGRLSAEFAVPQVGLISVRADGSHITTDGPDRDHPEVHPYSVWQLRRALMGGVEIAALVDFEHQLSSGADGLLNGATLRVRHGVQQVWDEGNQGRWTVLEETTPTAVFRYYIHPESHLIWRTERIDRSTGELVYASTLESFEVAR